MKLTAFNKLTEAQMEKMTINELKSLVSSHGKSANKRLYRIRSDKSSAQNAVRSVQRSGGSFGVAGKNTKEQLIKEAKRIQNFNRSKTGTVKGARSVKAEFQKRAKRVTAAQAERDYKKAYRRALEREVKKEARKHGIKINKKIRDLITAEVNKKSKEYRQRFERNVEDYYQQFQKSSASDAISEQGPYYYALSDGQGAGVSEESGQTDSKYGSPTKNKSNQNPGMHKPIDDSGSPLDLVSIEADEDFKEVSSDEIPSNFRTIR